ncbi:MAG TPA: hypothetical protein ENN80_09585 [Candidatus Hydrogenedentes bacterium]|nr:hypothetical protein [Candidatus Hydrogenedentota bacterium]
MSFRVRAMRPQDLAAALVGDVLSSLGGHTVVVDATGHAPERHEPLASLGFIAQRLLTRMHRSEPLVPEGRGTSFAIAGPELG